MTSPLKPLDEFIHEFRNKALSYVFADDILRIWQAAITYERQRMLELIGEFDELSLRNKAMEFWKAKNPAEIASAEDIRDFCLYMCRWQHEQLLKKLGLK